MDQQRQERQQQLSRGSRLTPAALALLIFMSSAALSGAFGPGSLRLHLRPSAHSRERMHMTSGFRLNGDTPVASDAQKGEELEEVDMQCMIDADSAESLAELEPLERQMIRLQGLEPYAILSTFMSTASYSTIQETIITNENGIQWNCVALLAACTISTLCGLYATVTFSLCVLYGKTALGLDKDDVYYRFLDETAQQRFRGFQFFSFSLLFFCIEVLMVVLEKVPMPLKIPAAFVAIGSVLFGYFEFKILTDAAEPIFRGVLPTGVSKKEIDGGISN